MITFEEIKEYRNRKNKLSTIGEFKELGREVRDKHNLTDRQALEILRSDNVDELLKVLEVNMKVEKSTDMGDTVICDQCNKDFTKSKESGGFIFGSHAYCPDCGKAALPRIKGYGEENHIKATCPRNMSFKDFVLQYRGGNNKVTVISLEDGDSFEDVFGNAK